MPGLLEDKVALVTGGSNGIGESTVKVFAREGAHVAIVDITEARGERLARMIKEMGRDALFIKTDVSQVDQVESMIERVVDHFGKLDCAFNNAGIEGNSAKTADCTEENWNNVIGINLKGVWLCMKYEIRYMLSRKSGVIVNNSSIAGLKGFSNLSPYVASKHGVIGLTRAAALEYAQQGIRINAVCPGVIRTPMVDRVTQKNPEIEARYEAMEPVGRMGSPDEVGEAVAWLCSDAASFVTGHPMVVDGGILAG